MDLREREWMHDLRNAANAVGISVTLGRRLVADGDHVRALAALDRAEVALVRIRDLLRGSAQGTADDTSSG